MKSSSKRTLIDIVMYAVCLVLFAVVGVCVGQFAAFAGAGSYDGSSVVELVVFLGVFLISVLLQIVVHEAGHLVFGLATGYSFVSFRVGPLMVERQRGRMRVYRFSLAGTGGQCLLRPPSFDDGKMAFKLYNMGGVIANLVAAAVCVAVAFIVPKHYLLVMAFMICGAVGLLSAIMNGVPLRTAQLANDAANTIDLSRNRDALYALWLQLEVNYRSVEGERLGDLPEEWFALPPADEWTNAMVATTCVLHENRLMDEGRYDEVAELVDALRATPNKIPGIYWALLDCDRMTVAILLGQEGVVDELWTKDQIKMMRALHNLPGVVRTEYALALLADKDRKAAARYQVKFEEFEGRYPNPGDIASEATIMADVFDAANGD